MYDIYDVYDIRVTAGSCKYLPRGFAGDEGRDLALRAKE